jgi:hypothetical protein
MGKDSSADHHPELQGRRGRRLAIRAERASPARRIYSRCRDLPRLLPLWPRELDDESEDAALRIVQRLRSALRGERRRASAGHWTYDLNRHVGLVQAYKAELMRLEALSLAGGHSAPTRERGLRPADTGTNATSVS